MCVCNTSRQTEYNIICIYVQFINYYTIYVYIFFSILSEKRIKDFTGKFKFSFYFLAAHYIHVSFLIIKALELKIRIFFIELTIYVCFKIYL